jgi:hypothetical protein
LIYGEAGGHLQLARQIYGERVLPKFQLRTFVNVVQYLRDFERFEMHKRLSSIVKRSFARISRGNPSSNSTKNVVPMVVITFKTPLRKFMKTEAFSIEFGFLGHVVLKLAL